MDNHTLYLYVRANQSTVTVERVEHHCDSPPLGQPLSQPVPPSIIGYWIEIKNSDDDAIYRQFIHHIPHNLDLTWSDWSSRQRAKAAYVIKIPALSSAHHIALYEQKITAPQQHMPIRQCHFNLLLQPTQSRDPHHYQCA